MRQSKGRQPIQLQSTSEHFKPTEEEKQISRATMMLVFVFFLSTTERIFYGQKLAFKVALNSLEKFKSFSQSKSSSIKSIVFLSEEKISVFHARRFYAFAS